MAELNVTSGYDFDHTICSVCGNILKEPQTLICLHSFCKSCVNTLKVESLKGENVESVTVIRKNPEEEVGEDEVKNTNDEWMDEESQETEEEADSEDEQDQDGGPEVAAEAVKIPVFPNIQREVKIIPRYRCSICEKVTRKWQLRDNNALREICHRDGAQLPAKCLLCSRFGSFSCICGTWPLCLSRRLSCDV